LSASRIYLPLSIVSCVVPGNTQQRAEIRSTIAGNLVSKLAD
jgi:hypothetical protein